MGQTQTQLKQSQDYRLIEQLPVGNIVKHNKTQSMHFLKQYSFTAQDAYQNALNAHSLKLANKNEHILNFLHFTTKSQNSFCSAFHKIILIFEYIDYSLQKQIETRTRDNRPFNQKQMWSVLCSCVLAAVHLIHSQGRMHCGLSPRDIRLNTNGCVKLLSHEMIGIDGSHTQAEGQPKMLVLTLLQCMMLEKMTNQDNKYLEKVIEGLDCSRELKDMLLMMIDKDSKFTELEQHLFKLVQDDDSLASHSNTPMLKSSSPINSNYKCPRIYRNDDKMKSSKITDNKDSELEPMLPDHEDIRSILFGIDYTHEVETPDQTQEQNTDPEHSNGQSPEKVDPFFLKERRVEANQIIHEAVSNFEKNKLGGLDLVQNSHSKSKENSQNVAYPTTSSYNISQVTGGKGNNQNLFTDPKLFSLIKNDLEEIKMRRSIGQLGRYTKTQQSKASLLSQNDSKQLQPPLRQALYNKPNALALETSNYLRVEEKSSQSSTRLAELEIIREASHESRNESQLPSLGVSKNQRKQQRVVDNIMDDNEMGFKKKKQATGKFEIPKETEPELEFTEARHKEKPEISARQLKPQLKIQPKSKTVGMKPVDIEPSPQPSQQFFDERSQTTTPELVHVNQKYTRGRYQGTKLNNKRHGYGTFYYSQGGKYVGNWKENKMHGKGTLYYPNQQIAYEGQWENDQLSGYGVLYNQEVLPLRNPFDYRDWTEVEDYWVKYEGHFKEDNKEGQGKLYLVNGQRFEGQFHQDKVDGEGVLYREGSSVRGKWKQNKLVRIF